MQALLNLLAVVGFGRRFRETGDDLDRWLALGSTLQLFAALHLVFTPPLGSDVRRRGRLPAPARVRLMLVGAWRAIRLAEFGRAVAEERARVAREIHDGLAQYLFAVSTHAPMLEAGAPVEEVGPQLKEAARAAQQEARFAILALSSASGTAPVRHRAAPLRRVPRPPTASSRSTSRSTPRSASRPDEQIEIFRIVQEGLGTSGGTRTQPAPRS